MVSEAPISRSSGSNTLKHTPPTNRPAKNEAKKLLDWGFENYRMETVVGAGETVFSEKAYGKEILIKAKTDICLPVTEGEVIHVEYEKEKVELPVKKGESAGKARVFLKDDCAYETELVYDSDIDRRSYADAFERVISAWPMLSVLRVFYR